MSFELIQKDPPSTRYPPVLFPVKSLTYLANEESDDLFPRRHLRQNGRVDRVNQLKDARGRALIPTV